MFVSKYQLVLAIGALAASVSAQDSAQPSSAASSSATPAASSTLDTAKMTASSNFTLPKPDATAVWSNSIKVAPSVDYVAPQLNLAAMPEINYSLANETDVTRQAICDRQTQWCATAGCAEAGAKVKDNFCNVANLGSRCTCDKGLSNLEQYKWPVQFADCTGRATACAYECMRPEVSNADRTACRQSCTDNFSKTCGLPGQFSANYAVSKDGQKPQLNMMQGGGANGASNVVLPVVTLAAVASLAVVLLAA